MIKLVHLLSSFMEPCHFQPFAGVGPVMNKRKKFSCEFVVEE